MKKLFLMLLAIALVGSFAFAEVTGVEAPSVSGSVTTTFGYNLDLEASGFNNDASVDVVVPLAGGSATGMGEGDIYAEITISDIEISLGLDAEDGDDEVEFDAEVSAKIVMGALYIGLNNPDLTFNAVDLEDDRDFNADAEGTGGISVGYMTEAFSFEVGVASKEDYMTDDFEAAVPAGTTTWYDTDDNEDDGTDADVANVDNNYLFGLNASVMAGPAVVDLYAAYDATYTADALMGFGANVATDLGVATLDLGFDYVTVGDDFGMDLSADLGADVGVGTLTVSFLMQNWDVVALSGAGDYMEAGLTFDAALAEELTLVVGFTMEDLTADEMAWEATLEASYDMGAVVPYLETGYDSDEELPLTIGADFPLVIDNAVLNVEYASDNVADFENFKGIVKVGVTVEF